jgi:hypothetical protein
MSDTIITVGDPGIDFELNVFYDRLAEGGIEINAVRCIEVVVWCGKNGVSASPADEEYADGEGTIGRWCLERYGDEIEQALIAKLEEERWAEV